MYFRSKSNINILMLIRIIGWLLLIESAFMIIPLITSLIYKEDDYISFIISIIATSLCGLGSVAIKPKNKEMGKREAILLTSSIWMVFTIFGMLPFMIYGTHETVTDAFFETMSGFTTTGATLIDYANEFPKGILMWRCIIQWIGGMGIILFTLAVLPMLNYQGGIQLFHTEVTGITHDKIRPRVSSTAKGLWLVYFILTIVLIFLLMFSGMTPFEAICHGISTMSTGGFSTSDMTLNSWTSIYTKIVISIFMFIGGVNFALLYKTFTGQFKGILKNDALKWYIFAIVFAYIIITLNICFLGDVKSWEDVTIDPIFQVISILSSTGIVGSDLMNWGQLTIFVIIMMMFVGASAGSTAGGAKIDRIIVVLKFIKNEFYKMLHPNTVTTVRINGNGTPTAVLHKSLAFIFLYILVIIVGSIFLSITGLSMKESLFYALTSISNTGLGVDVIGLEFTYNSLPDAAKWILSSIMLIGRLELFTILLIFTPYFWKK